MTDGSIILSMHHSSQSLNLGWIAVTFTIMYFLENNCEITTNSSFVSLRLSYTLYFVITFHHPFTFKNNIS